MKTYAIVLIVCGSVAAALIVMYCLCNIRKKKKTEVPTTVRPPLRTNLDLEMGKTSKTNNSRTNDGDKVILSVAAASVVIDTSGGGGCSGGGCGGGCSGGGCGGGCGGGD